MLVDFAEDAAFPICWYTLGPEDRDLKVFLAHLVASIRSRFPGFGAQIQTLLDSVQDVQRELPTLVATLINEIASDVPELFAIAFDDFHAVDDSPTISRAMDELLRYLPDNCRILIASRTVPRLTYTSLAARLQVAGLGTSELRFSGEEVRKLLKERHRVLLLPDQAEQLASEAEGWITGILLTTHSLWRGLLETLTRAKDDGGFVYEYLADDVLREQPLEMVDFLTISSVQALTNASELEALVGEGPWAALLERAEADGLFLSRLQGEQTWYRYHHLFRDFLQQRFAAQDPARFAALHARAGDLAGARGELATALDHYRRADQEERGALLVESRLGSLVASGTWRLLADLVDGLSESIRAAHPSLLLARGEAACWLGEVDSAEQIGTQIASSAAGADLARALLVRGTARRLRGQLADAACDLERAAQLARDDPALLAQVQLMLGLFHGTRGDLDTSVQHLSQAHRLYEAHGDARNLALARYNLGVTSARRGDLAEAERHYRAALDTWERLGNAFSTAEVLNSLGMLQYLRGDYAQALETLDQALALARKVGYVRVQAYILESLAAVKRALGDLTGALGHGEEALELARRLGETSILAILLDSLANIWRRFSDLDKATTLAKQAQQIAETYDSLAERGAAQLTLGAIDLARGDPRQALARFRSARALLQRAGASRDLVRLRLRLIQAHWALGEEALAQREASKLAQALRRGGLYGLVAPEAAEQPAVLRAIAAQGAPELTRLLTLSVQLRAAEPAPAPAPLRQIERPRWPEVRAYALGPPRVECNGVLVSGAQWESGKAVELFFYLLAASNGEVPTEQIIAALWPESSPARGQSNLWTSVYRLRRAIHSDAISRRRGVYSLNPELPVWEDASELERLLAQAETAQGDEQAELLRAAIGLYRGPYLDGIYADWCLHRRTVLETGYLLALNRLVRYELARGEYHAALDYAQRILAVDQFHEDAHHQVIELHRLLGDRVGGTRHYQRYVSLLQDELGEEPSPRVRAAYQALLRDSRAQN